MKGNGKRGTSVVELAICLPLLLMIVFGIIEFGFLLYDKAVITNASREGARAGIVFHHPDRISDGEIINVATNYCSTHLVSLGSSASPSVNVARAGPGGGSAAGDSLTVTVTYPYTFLVLPNLNDFFGGVLPGGITLTAQTVMRLE
jgi:Flp pilus assembly protein TadG